MLKYERLESIEKILDRSKDQMCQKPQSKAVYDDMSWLITELRDAWGTLERIHIDSLQPKAP